MFTSIQGLDVEPNVAIINPIRIGNALHVHIPVTPYISLNEGARVDLLVDVETMDMKLVRHPQSNVVLSSLGSYLAAIFPYTPALDSVINRPFKLSSIPSGVHMALHVNRDTPVNPVAQTGSVVPSGSMATTRTRKKVTRPSGVLTRHGKLSRTPIAVRPTFERELPLQARLLPWIMERAGFEDGTYVRASLINDGKSCQVVECKAEDVGSLKVQPSNGRAILLKIHANGYKVTLSGSASLIGPSGRSKVSNKKIRFNLPYPETALTDTGFHIEKVVQSRAKVDEAPAEQKVVDKEATPKKARKVRKTSA